MKKFAVSQYISNRNIEMGRILISYQNIFISSFHAFMKKVIRDYNSYFVLINYISLADKMIYFCCVFNNE